jgi:hypothetical protein
MADTTKAPIPMLDDANIDGNRTYLLSGAYHWKTDLWRGLREGKVVGETGEAVAIKKVSGQKIQE